MKLSVRALGGTARVLPRKPSFNVYGGASCPPLLLYNCLVIELLDLLGNNGVTLTLYGVTDYHKGIKAFGYLCKAPHARMIPDPSVVSQISFFKPLVPKPLRKGCVFRQGKHKFKCLDTLEVDKVMFFPTLLPDVITLERMNNE